jgi:hypothetical protein
MAFTMPFKEIVELTEIFLDSAWFAKLINTFLTSNEPIINEKKQKKRVRRIKFYTFLFYTTVFVKSNLNSCIGSEKNGHVMIILKCQGV